ncbi:hypothetical protein RIF29_00569 [Crotalaria pallida]|uniref:Uncharacterized protein n=1 Tax=Crotalaria pallida TaxID=3830 RepID=A0AAN9P7I9_CROPI
MYIWIPDSTFLDEFIECSTLVNLARDGPTSVDILGFLETSHIGALRVLPLANLGARDIDRHMPRDPDRNEDFNTPLNRRQRIDLWIVDQLVGVEVVPAAEEVAIFVEDGKETATKEKMLTSHAILPREEFSCGPECGPYFYLVLPYIYPVQPVTKAKFNQLLNIYGGILHHEDRQF